MPRKTSPETPWSNNSEPEARQLTRCLKQHAGCGTVRLLRQGHTKLVCIRGSDAIKLTSNDQILRHADITGSRLKNRMRCFGFEHL